MQLVNEFSVAAPADAAFAKLSDLECIAACMPGAVLDEVRGDEYVGHVRVRIGPVGLSFSGVATIVEKDPAQRRLVVRGSGKDKGGQGRADALITMTVSDDGDTDSVAGARVRVVTDLGLSGKVGQFGGAAINQVSGRLIGQFVQRMDAVLRGEAGTPLAAQQGWASRARTAVSRRASQVTWDQLSPVLVTVGAGLLLGLAVARALRAAVTSGRVRENRLQLDD